MSRRALRFVALAVLAALLLGAAGAVAWSWVADYLSYRQFISSRTPPEQNTETSFEEFLLYRRLVTFYDTAEALAARNATAEEVRAVLGKPDQIEQINEYNVWFYSGSVFRGYRTGTIVLDINAETSRVTHIGYITLH